MTVELSDGFSVVDLVRHLQVVLRLTDWNIEVSDEPADDGCYAVIDPCDDRKYAVVRVAADFETLAIGQRVHSVAHELIHHHFAAAGNIIRLDVNRHLSQQAYEILWQGFRRQIEYGVDGLADAVMALLGHRLDR